MSGGLRRGADEVEYDIPHFKMRLGRDENYAHKQSIMRPKLRIIPKRVER